MATTTNERGDDDDGGCDVDRQMKVKTKGTKKDLGERARDDDELTRKSQSRGRETRGNAGWSALEAWANLGVVWDFITPSSPEGRQVIKRAHASRGNKLRGISGWKKAMWDEAGAKAPIAFVDSHTPLPGCRGYRVCWCAANDMPQGQKRDVVMFYVASSRKFYFERDIELGAVKAEDADESFFKTPEEILDAQRRIFNVNQTYADVYRKAVKDDWSQDANWETFEDALIRAAGVAAGEAAQDAAGARAEAANDASFESPVEGWKAGVGVTPENLYTRLGVNYDFHGPAGVVSRAIISTVGEQRGMDLSNADAWAKQKWIDAATELGITAESTHAPLSVVGRGWKVCWIDGNEEMDAPAVLVWSPEEGKYFSLGAVKRKGKAAGASMDTILRAVLGVAKSLPSPPGLKEALARDGDFLQLIGRAPASPAPLKIVLPEVEASFDDSEEGTVYVEVDEGEDGDDDESGDEEEEDLDIAGALSGDVAKPSARRDKVETDSRFEVSKVDTDPVLPSVIEDRTVSDMPAGGLNDYAQDGATAAGEFYSRSAGYLSFVENGFDDEDLKRELGIDREDMYRGPKDFPDLSKNPKPTPTREMAVNLRESMPKGLPKPHSAYHSFELHQVDFIVSKMNDGRLDLREVYSAKRDSYGRFVEEAQRVNTAAFMSMPPAYYHEIAWTELRVTNQEDFDSDAPIPSFNTTDERTTKIYLVFARNEPSIETAYDRKLDFTKPVVMFNADAEMSAVKVQGATNNPNASLVIKDGELYCQDELDLPTFEDVIRAYESNTTPDKPNVSQEFLIETDTEVEARAMEEEEDTPEVDNL